MIKHALAAALALSTWAAHGAVMTFDFLANDGDIWGVQVGPDVSQAGFVIHSCSSRCGASNLVAWSRFDHKQADPGGATLVAGAFDIVLTLEHVDKQPFDFYSIDIADLYNIASNGTLVEFDFLREGRPTESASALVTVPMGLQRFVFDQTGVSAVRFFGRGTGGIGQIDNVVLDARPLSAPGGLALSALMLATVGAMRTATRSPVSRGRSHA